MKRRDIGARQEQGMDVISKKRHQNQFWQGEVRKRTAPSVAEGLFENKGRTSREEEQLDGKEQARGNG